MPTLIFNTFADFKQHVSGAVNQSLEIDSVAATMEEVANTYLIPWLTPDLWDALVTEVKTPANPVATALRALLPYVQKPLALLTMWEYAQIGNVQFSEGGLMRVESETHKTAYKYQENAYREKMREHGFNALERMLLFLEKNKANYPHWVADGGLARHRAVFLHYAATMQDASAYKISRYTYQVMRPLIADLEQFVLLKEFGHDFYDLLRTRFLADTLTTKQTELLQLARRAITHFTIAEGTRRAWVQFNGDAVVQREKLEPQSYEKEGAATAAATGPTIDINGEWGNRHLSYLRKYLADNIAHADFALYNAYQEDLAAAAAKEAEAEHATQSPPRGDLGGIPTVDATDYGRAPTKGTFRF